MWPDFSVRGSCLDALWWVARGEGRKKQRTGEEAPAQEMMAAYIRVQIGEEGHSDKCGLKVIDPGDPPHAVTQPFLQAAEVRLGWELSLCANIAFFFWFVVGLSKTLWVLLC